MSDHSVTSSEHSDWEHVDDGIKKEERCEKLESATEPDVEMETDNEDCYEPEAAVSIPKKGEWDSSLGESGILESAQRMQTKILKSTVEALKSENAKLKSGAHVAKLKQEISEYERRMSSITKDFGRLEKENDILRKDKEILEAQLEASLRDQAKHREDMASMVKRSSMEKGVSECCVCLENMSLGKTNSLERMSQIEKENEALLAQCRSELDAQRSEASSYKTLVNQLTMQMSTNAINALAVLQQRDLEHTSEMERAQATITQLQKEMVDQKEEAKREIAKESAKCEYLVKELYGVIDKFEKEVKERKAAEEGEKAKEEVLKPWMSTVMDQLGESNKKVEEITRRMFKTIVEIESEKEEVSSPSEREKSSNNIKKMEKLCHKIQEDAKETMAKHEHSAEVLLRLALNTKQRRYLERLVGTFKLDKEYVAPQVVSFKKTSKGTFEMHCFYTKTEDKNQVAAYEFVKKLGYENFKKGEGNMSIVCTHAGRKFEFGELDEGEEDVSTERFHLNITYNSGESATEMYKRVKKDE